MTFSDRRYTDRDVRESHDLLERAVEFASNYTGDFDFLVAAQDLVHASGTLTVAVARGVLNCMRADPRVAPTLPAPSYGDGGYEGNVVPIRPPRGHWRQREQPVEPEPLPLPDPQRSFWLRVNVKKEYGLAGRGRVLHRVQSARCEWSTYPLTNSGYVDWRVKSAVPLRPVTFEVQWWCNTRAKWPTLHGTIPEKIPQCRSGCWWPRCDHGVAFQACIHCYGNHPEVGGSGG